jgi:hypothetical protein
MITLTCQTLDDINIYEFTYFEYHFGTKEQVEEFKRLSSTLAYMINHNPQNKKIMIENNKALLVSYDKRFLEP